MSFLNPVNEPVLRFSSTDASAPQINYNARVAGDVKTVLKACLVTGYGAKASAGWSVVNEVDHVAEFVSPSAAMSDYRLAIDDTSASTTTWYYKYQSSKVNLTGASTLKSPTPFNLSHASNGWDLLVTSRGFYFIDNLYHTTVASLCNNVIYFGALKSTVSQVTSKNIAWFCLGFSSSPIVRPTDFFIASPNSNSQHFALDSTVINSHSHPNITGMSTFEIDATNKSYVGLYSDWYLKAANDEIVAKQVGVLLKFKVDTTKGEVLGVSEINGRPVILFWPVRSQSDKDLVLASSRTVMAIYLDSWSY